MAQWDRLRQLPIAYRQQLHELYDRDALPMDVRHYLAPWIEKQEWQRAARDHAFAMVLFQVLLENLDIQHSRFVQEESFLLQHNIRRYKQNFQRYVDDPCALATTILWFLEKEKEILDSAELAEKVQLLQVEPEAMETSSQQDLERKLAGLRNEVQCMEHTIICLEEQQDEFDFKFQTQKLEGKQMKTIWLYLHALMSVRSTLSGLNDILDRIQDIIDVLVKKELVEWQRRQQKACIGAPDNVCLDQLEKWFSCVAVCLFQVWEFLTKLEELVGKVSYENDPVKAQNPTLQKRVDTLLRDLLKSSFVVETQPSMPQGKGSLVLRTNVQFSVKARLLVKFPELNHSMKVDVSMDNKPPVFCRYRRFNVLGTKIKALNMAESTNGAIRYKDFYTTVTQKWFKTKYLTIGYMFLWHTHFQQQSAWASVLWFNMLSQDPKDVMFFANTPAATWPQFGEMLSWQFLSATKRGLDDTQLEMIANKLFGKKPNYDSCTVPWSKFTKENTPDTFWVWFDGILMMVKTYLEDLWRDGLIMGFVTKGKEKSLLKKKKRGTFLLRFSESVIGGITFSWVEITVTGEPDVKTVQPFTKVDLSQIPFHEIIRNYQILEAENVPENPLLYLYPDTPKDKAFGKYYTEKSGEDSPYIKYIKTKLVFVSKDESINKLHSDDNRFNFFFPSSLLEQDGDLYPLTPPLESYDPDPMMNGSVEDPEPPQDLLMYLNNPNLFDNDLLQDDQSLPDFSLQGFNCLLPQSCGSFP
uniref:Signal transducer and activator of transcription n=1 Tax=Haplochromis burtoni TaxID=8153 RepID=A0A3Q2VNS5_HAPBU